MGKEQNSGTSDEQLFEMHRKARKKKRRRLVITLCIVIVVVIVAVIIAVFAAQRKISSTLGSSESDVESAEVTTGSISTTVSGSGTLSSTDVESIDILSSVEIVEFYVETGDTVSEGDLIATVTNSSLLSAMSEKQEELDTIDAEIEEAEDSEVSSSISAAAGGRVKKIYADEDDAVADVMYENGCLLLLSLDGYMAVDIETDELSSGDTVTVTLSDGDSVTGTVESSAAGTAVILVSDSAADYADEVTVSDSDGNTLGTGTLYIHEQLKVTGYAGTISSVSVSENESVSSGDTLFTLTDTDSSVAYDSLLNEREEIEEQLETLVTIYKEGGICATVSGTVESLTDQGSTSSSADAASASSSSTASSEYTVVEIAPDSQMTITISVDETDILSLEEGQEAAVTIDSIGEDSFTGSVTEISTTATSSSGVTAYSAVVTIDKTEDMLSGMSASVVITIEGVEDALLIPVDALHQTSSTSYVYTEYDESTGEFSGMVEVTTGLSNSSYVEITDGLSEGDTVYYTASGEDSSDLSSFIDSMGGGMDMDSTGGMGGDTSGTTGGDSSGGMSLPSGGMPSN